MGNEARATYSLSCNSKPKNWRMRFGGLLRGIADWLDGRTSLAIEMFSSTGLSTQERLQIMTSGIDHMRRGLRSCVEEACVEELMRHDMPQLYAVDLERHVHTSVTVKKKPSP